MRRAYWLLNAIAGLSPTLCVILFFLRNKHIDYELMFPFFVGVYTYASLMTIFDIINRFSDRKRAVIALCLCLVFAPLVVPVYSFIHFFRNSDLWNYTLANSKP